MVSALYLQMSFLDSKIPHLIAERFSGKTTSTDLTYITKRERQRENNYLSEHIFQLFYLSVFGATAPQWAKASSFTRFLDHIQRHTTVGRTPLDE